MDNKKFVDVLRIAQECLNDAVSGAETLLTPIYTPDSFKERIKGQMGRAESYIEQAFDIINGVRAPKKISPEDVEKITCSNGENIGKSSMLTDFGISADKDAVDIIRQTVNENEFIQMGEVDETKVDGAIGADTLEQFFRQIASDAVKGEIFKYGEKSGNPLTVSFELNLPKTATKAYAVQMMALFAHWLDEYGFSMSGTYHNTSGRSIRYDLSITDTANEDGKSDDVMKILPAGTEEERKHIENIVIAAALTIKNAHTRGGGRIPNLFKVRKVTSETVEKIHSIVAIAIGIGLKAVAASLMNYAEIATVILRMLSRNDFSMTEDDLEKFNTVV